MLMSSARPQVSRSKRSFAAMFTFEANHVTLMRLETGGITNGTRRARVRSSRVPPRARRLTQQGGGVANATLASFLCPRPSLASRQLGCHRRWLHSPGSATRVRPRRICAAAAHLSGKELQFLLADDSIKLLSTLHRQSTCATFAPIKPGASPRATASISGLMSMPGDTPAPPSCSFAKLERILNVTDVRLAVSDSRGYRSRALRS
jgi:hypothetical protein